MNLQQTIERKIRDALTPLHLEVENESHRHSVPPDAQTHFRLVVVSDQFEGEMLVHRHRRINRLLQQEFDSGLHALALHTLTPEEWFRKGCTTADSPQCLGGKQG